MLEIGQCFFSFFLALHISHFWCVFFFFFKYKSKGQRSQTLKNVNSISIQRGIPCGMLKDEHMRDSLSAPWSDTLFWCIADSPSTSGNTFPVEEPLTLCLFPLTSAPTCFELWFPRYPTCTQLPATHWPAWLHGDWWHHFILGFSGLAVPLLNSARCRITVQTLLPTWSRCEVCTLSMTGVITVPSTDQVRVMNSLIHIWHSIYFRQHKVRKRPK